MRWRHYIYMVLRRRPPVIRHRTTDAAVRKIVPLERELEKNLRDEFAMAALTGLLGSGQGYVDEVTAELAYEMADAMMKKRTREQES